MIHARDVILAPSMPQQTISGGLRVVTTRAENSNNRVAIKPERYKQLDILLAGGWDFHHPLPKLHEKAKRVVNILAEGVHRPHAIG